MHKEVKSTAKLQTYVAHEKKDSMKKVVKSKVAPRGDRDGRIMAKILITTMQVNWVPIPEAWRRQHKFT